MAIPTKHWFWILNTKLYKLSNFRDFCRSYICQKITVSASSKSSLFHQNCSVYSHSFLRALQDQNLVGYLNDVGSDTSTVSSLRSCLYTTTSQTVHLPRQTESRSTYRWLSFKFILCISSEQCRRCKQMFWKW